MVEFWGNILYLVRLFSQTWAKIEPSGHTNLSHSKVLVVQLWLLNWVSSNFKRCPFPTNPSQQVSSVPDPVDSRTRKSPPQRCLQGTSSIAWPQRLVNPIRAWDFLRRCLVLGAKSVVLVISHIYWCLIRVSSSKYFSITAWAKCPRMPIRFLDYWEWFNYILHCIPYIFFFCLRIPSPVPTSPRGPLPASPTTTASSWKTRPRPSLRPIAIRFGSSSPSWEGAGCPVTSDKHCLLSDSEVLGLIPLPLAHRLLCFRGRLLI